MYTDLRALDERLSRRVWVLPALVVLVSLILVACTAGLVVTAVRTPSAEALDRSREDALSAGQKSAKVLLSYDYRTLEKDFAAGREVATGEFRDQYAKTTSKTVTPNAKKLHVTVTAEVVSGSVVTASTDRVELLLYVNQNTVSDAVKNGRIDQNRVQMTMIEQDGDWLVSQLKSL